MKTFWMTAALLVLPFIPATSAGQTLDAPPDARQRQTSVVSVETTRRPADPLDTRASFRFTNSPTGDVLRILAKAAELDVELPPTPLPQVTLTLSNVRLRVALDAICDTAACNWRLDGRTVKITTSASAPAGGLPPTVSVALKEMSVADVFRALGDALGIPVLVEGNVDRPPVTVTFTSADTTTVLNFLCKSAGCGWEFDDTTRTLRVRFKGPL